MILGSRQNYFGIHFDPGYNPGPETSVRFIDGTIQTFNVTEINRDTIQLTDSTHSYSSITDLSVGSLVSGMSYFFEFDGYVVSNILIPPNVKYIGMAFCQNGPNLSNIVFPDGILSIGEEQFIGYHVFSNTKISKITLPSSLNLVGFGAFRGEEISSIIIQDGTTDLAIGNSFWYSSIADVTVPSSVVNFRSDTFKDMGKLKTVTFLGKTISQVTSNINYAGSGYNFRFGIGYVHTYHSSPPDTSAPITVICEDGQFTVDWIVECFAKGTKILMSDGTEKNIEDVNYGDSLKVWDFDSGNISESEVCWLTNRGQRSDHYYRLTFSDGTVLKTTGANSNHKIYNVDKNRFEGVNVTQIGDRIYSFNGIVTVTNKEYVKEEVEYYNLMTTRTINCFANGILASNRQSNIYPVVNMVYDKTGRTIRPYSEFQEQGIRRYWYDHIRLGESQETVSKLAEYVGKIESQMWKPDWWE